MPTKIHSELKFEEELCDKMAAHGWTIRTHLKDATSYRRDVALFPDDLIAFVQETQPEEWAKFKKWHNGKSEEVFVKRVAAQLDKHGTLHVLRNGFKDVDARFQLCAFKPAHRKNAKLDALYKKNRLTVIRQLHYSLNNENSIDVVLFVNGIPVATSELKTDLTQSVQDAINQYKKNRLPRDPKTREPEALLQFKTRALVHFAMSTDLVFMTTKLDGDSTYFLPFNLGRREGNDRFPDGAGNPPAPGGHGYPTYYMWEFVWTPEVWLDILGSFMLLETKDVEVNGKKVTKESLIFPRFHQLNCVSELIRHAGLEGPGKPYLIQHSAGSGKSNTIAWTAHRLSNLHDANDKKVFDSVIVVTDRRVLDKQLQDTISQFEHKRGVVQVISENSNQLAEALNAGAPIVVTTLQKFGFVLDKINETGHRNFALLFDEAHSSQTGSAAGKLRQALTKKTPTKVQATVDGETVEVDVDAAMDPEDVTSEDIINSVLASRKRPENVSYFAFTATPKAKTLELFGRKPDGEDLPIAFHVYSMRQAIEEGFILDVLKNYISYEHYYKLRELTAEKLVPQKKAKQVLAHYAKLHPHSIAQKVAIIVEHFREHVMAQLGGKAKAMVVTDSRRAAVRYKLAIDKYIREQKYGLKTLVAFSGTVVDSESGPGEFTESNMNAEARGVEPADAFKDDEYRILLVANKYQVGFDQPLLHTMYVDKRLTGVLAVQTLSRLNRTYPGKQSTCVLDFVNSPDDILKSFLPYYRTAELEATTDPNLVHELMTKLIKANVFLWSEVEQFAEAFFDPKVKSQAALHKQLKPAADRYDALEDDEQRELFRKDLQSFCRLYEFLSQIVPYDDPELEKLHAFGKLLLPRLTTAEKGSLPVLDEDVQLTHYRVQKLGEQQLSLESGEVTKLPGIKEVGTGQGLTDEQKALREIVGRMNELFAGQVTEADLIGAATAWTGHLMSDASLREQALNNSEEQFGLGDFKKAFTDVVIDAQDAQNEIAEQMLKDERVFNAVMTMMSKRVWQHFQQQRPH